MVGGHLRSQYDAGPRETHKTEEYIRAQGDGYGTEITGRNCVFNMNKKKQILHRRLLCILDMMRYRCEHDVYTIYLCMQIVRHHLKDYYVAGCCVYLFPMDGFEARELQSFILLSSFSFWHVQYKNSPCTTRRRRVGTCL